MENNRSGISWTRQQAHVIDTRRGNLLVSAAAGSGKTAVLVERIIEMVTGVDSQGGPTGDAPVDIDELLVVTFTNAAAAQMREKIASGLSKKLDEAASGSGISAEAYEHLVRQMTLINHAEICTIDSFCLRIVKEYFSRVDLDASFDIADNAEMEVMKAEVMDTVLERCYEDSMLVPGFHELIGAFSKREKDMAVPGLVNRLVNIVSSFPEPYTWLAEAERQLCELPDADSEPEVKKEAILSMGAVRAFAGEVSDIIESAYGLVRYCQEICGKAGGFDAYLLRIDRDAEMLAHMRRICDNADGETVDIFALKEVYNSSRRVKGVSPETDADGNKLYYAFDPLVRLYTKPDPKVANDVKNRRKAYVKLVSDVMSVIADADEIVMQSRMTAPVMSALISLTRLYMDELMQAKRDRNLFEFHDIEEFAYQILCDGIEDGKARPSDVGREVSERYREILIDEYQDSNFLQEYILGSITGHGEGASNMFMVGDVKQSIYGFRSARPDLFMNKYDSYRHLADDEDAGAVSEDNCIVLSRNFRSRINVLMAVNSIFARLMSRRLGGIEYDGSAKLSSGSAVEDEQGELSELPETEVSYGARAEFALIENDTGKAWKSSGVSNVRVEAAYIASKIDELVNGPEPFVIGEGDTQRPVRYSDIAILLRGVSAVSFDYEEVFEDMGIPLYIESESGYFDATEISTLVAMLSVVDNAYIDYDMAAVLRSPLVGLSEEELAVIAGEFRSRYEQEKTVREARLYDKVLEYDSAHEGEDSDTAAKVTGFLKLLTYLKENKNYMSISDIIRYVLDETGYYWFAGARPMGKRRQANIDMLIKKADDFETTGKGVFNFIRYVDKLRTNNLDFAEVSVLGENDDVVRAMTMHKSKGLEFPVVFAAGLGRQFNLMDQKSAVLMHQDYYLACDAIDARLRVRKKSFAKRVMARVMNSQSYAEEQRVLYVALTRAKEKLYMTACCADSQKFMDDASMLVVPSDSYSGALGRAAVMDASCYAEWLCAAYSADSLELPEGAPYEMSMPRASEFAEVLPDGRIVLRQSYGKKTGKSCEAATDEQSAQDVAARIRENLSFEYPYTHSGLKSKMSITEIKRLQERGDEDDTPVYSRQRSYAKRTEVPVPAFMSAKAAVHGNEIGTIYHKIMELADFSDCSEEAAQLDTDRVFELNLFDEAYREKINPEKIFRMKGSSLGRRMAAADVRGELFRERQFYMMMTPSEISDSFAGCEDETVVVQGIIDAYFIEDGGIILMDYKTDTVNCGAELVEKYHVQLDKYADVLRRLTDMEVREKLIYSFCLDEVISL